MEHLCARVSASVRSSNQRLQTQALLAVLLGSVLLGSVSLVNAQDAHNIFFEDPASVYGEEVRYRVYRNGKAIGQHSVRFRKQKSSLIVTVESSLAVRYLGVPVYRYAYTSEELWVDGRLVEVESRIKDNFKKVRVIKARVSGRLLEITDRGKTRTAPLVRFPSNHWHPAVVTESRVFHTLHGKVQHVRILDVGLEKIQLRGTDGGAQERVAVIQARRYQYTGGFLADVWYDKQLRWVKLAFNADDGSLIEYRCITCLP